MHNMKQKTYTNYITLDNKEYNYYFIMDQVKGPNPINQVAMR